MCAAATAYPQAFVLGSPGEVIRHNVYRAARRIVIHCTRRHVSLCWGCATKPGAATSPTYSPKRATCRPSRLSPEQHRLVPGPGQHGACGDTGDGRMQPAVLSLGGLLCGCLERHGRMPHTRSLSDAWPCSYSGRPTPLPCQSQAGPQSAAVTVLHCPQPQLQEHARGGGGGSQQLALYAFACIGNGHLHQMLHYYAATGWYPWCWNVGTLLCTVTCLGGLGT